MKNFFLTCCLAIFAFSAQAVIIPNGDGSGNTTGTGAGDGWDYTGSIFFAGGNFNASGVYLGNYGGTYWVLTAYHISGTAGGAGFGAGLGTINLGGFTYDFTGSLGMRVPGIDLYLAPITSGSAAALNYLNSLSNLNLAQSTAAVGTDVTMIGSGRNRDASELYWSVNTGTTPWAWTATTSGSANAAGFIWSSSGNPQRWGTNEVSGSATVNAGGYGTTQTIYTIFDDVSNEAQASVGDSGGGVYIYDSGTTTLSGLMLYTGTYSGQGQTYSGGLQTAVFGNPTYYADISQYRTQILSMIVPEPGTLTLLALGTAMLLWVTRRGREGERSYRYARAESPRSRRPVR